MDLDFDDATEDFRAEVGEFPGGEHGVVPD